MKPQDIIFVGIFLTLLGMRKTTWLFMAGCVSLLVSLPLFSFWIFFTAERLTWYAAACMGAAICMELLFRKEKYT
jgi:hypothetical protein